MSEKHTPGPWQAFDTMDQGCMSYCHPEGCLENHPSGIFQVDGPAWDENYLGAGVAAVSNPADAHLIAAAPELLAALKQVASDRHACDVMKRRAEAAIAKAEGR